MIRAGWRFARAPWNLSEGKFKKFHETRSKFKTKKRKNKRRYARRAITTAKQLLPTAFSPIPSSPPAWWYTARWNFANWLIYRRVRRASACARDRAAERARFGENCAYTREKAYEEENVEGRKNVAGASTVEIRDGRNVRGNVSIMHTRGRTRRSSEFHEAYRARI